MVLYDATIGNALHAVNTVAVAYFVFWMALTPFIDDTHFTQGLFPPREYGAVIPAAAVVIFFGVALSVAAIHLRRVDEPTLSRLLDPATSECPPSGVAQPPALGAPAMGSVQTVG